MKCEFVDSLGEHLRQDRSDLLPREHGTSRERVNPIRPKRISNITGSSLARSVQYLPKI